VVLDERWFTASATSTQLTRQLHHSSRLCHISSIIQIRCQKETMHAQHLPTDKLNEKRTDKLKIKAVSLTCYSIKYFHKNVTYHSHMFITTTFNSWCIIKMKLKLNIYTKIRTSTQCCSHTWGFRGELLFVFNGSNFFSLKHKLTVQTQTIYCYYFRTHKETNL